MKFYSAKSFGILEKDIGNAGGTARLLDFQKTYSIDPGVKDVWCFPFWTVLKAIHWANRRIDYFSLDVEGSELSILKSLPWDRLDFGVIQVLMDI